ncbi:hypothetical protein WR25_12876 [Diploscapter pachys]|uniref:G-protein coupled receptors family 1 profile domain-containing protein n=1 Tax=Diploscapter pachys TaxID=2018661 RepID=A0A2A2KT50_9BILA|nr:hypothetical protein WR25_12876 [Diploscapter pachys]
MYSEISVLNILRYWEIEWVIENEQLTIKNTSLRDNLLYKLCQEAIIYGIFIYTVPMAILLFLNVAIIPLIFSTDLVSFKVTIENARKSAEHRAARMTFCIFLLFFLCITLSISIRLFFLLYGDDMSYMWMIVLSNGLINYNALSSPIISFLCTRGFHDLFFDIRYPYGVTHKERLSLSQLFGSQDPCPYL